MTDAVTTVGWRALPVSDAVQGARVPVDVLYPAHAPDRVEAFGPYELAVARDAAVAGDRLPVVVVSHGNNGSPWSHRDLAAQLARSGFVVALVEHTGNSRADGSLANTRANLANRPRHVTLALDALAADGALGPHVDARRAAVVGHSIGAYTALAVAGGRPRALPHEAREGEPRDVDVARDPRVRALVLLAPAAGWLGHEGALADVDLPILMRTGELDAITPAFHAEIVLRGVRDASRVEHAVVPRAGHFSFQSPFPPAMQRPDFPPAHDPEGFDRAAYQEVLAADVVAFLRRALGAG